MQVSYFQHVNTSGRCHHFTYQMIVENQKVHWVIQMKMHKSHLNC